LVLDSTPRLGNKQRQARRLNGNSYAWQRRAEWFDRWRSQYALSDSGGNAAITFSGSITKANQGNVVNIGSRTAGQLP